jgi:hypothetical protein
MAGRNVVLQSNLREGDLGHELDYLIKVGGFTATGARPYLFLMGKMWDLFRS